MSYRSAIENLFPHLTMGLCDCWGKPECLDYLERLLFDARGERQGFPADAYAELLFLYTLVERKRSPYDIWFEADLHG